MPDFHEFHVLVREIFVRTVVVHARDDLDAKMRVNGGQGTPIGEPHFLVQLNPDHWEVLPPSVSGAAESMEEAEGL